MRLCLYAALSCLIFLWCLPVVAENGVPVKAPNIPNAVIEPEKSVPGITLYTKNVAVKVFKVGKKSTPYALVDAIVANKNLNIVNEANGKSLVPRPDASGHMYLREWVPLKEDTTLVTWMVVDPTGEVKLLMFSIKVPGLSDIVAPARRPASIAQQSQTTVVQPKNVTLLASIGPSNLAYTQSDFGSFSGITMTGKVGTNFALSRRFSVGINAFMNLLPIASPSPTASLRFLGLNGRIGYRLPWPRDPWSLTLSGGVYYFTMIGTNEEFGIMNVTMPQLYPTLRYTINSRNTLNAYFKYAPVVTGFGLRSMESREIAGGGGWAYTLGNGHPFTLSFDFSSLSLSIEEQKGTLTSMSLNFGYGF